MCLRAALASSYSLYPDPHLELLRRLLSRAIHVAPGHVQTQLRLRPAHPPLHDQRLVLRWPQPDLPAAGTFDVDQPTVTCAACPAGSTSTVASAACAACPPGSIAAPGTLACSPCAGGSYDTGAQTDCTPCAPRLSSPSGETVCLACPDNIYSSGAAPACGP